MSGGSGFLRWGGGAVMTEFDAEGMEEEARVDEEPAEGVVEEDWGVV